MPSPAKKAVSPKLHPLESLGNTVARNGEIRVERIEDRLDPRVPFPHRHDFFHLLYLERGTGWHEIDFIRYPARAGQLFVMRPSEVHSWQLGASTRGFVLEFTADSLPKGTEELLGRLRAFPSMTMIGSISPLPSLLALMQEEFAARKKGFPFVLEKYLLVVLALLARVETTAPKTSAASDSLNVFRELVEKNFMREHAVDFYARALGISAKALTTKCKRILGKSAGLVIQDRCLVEAKRLLAYSQLSVAEIGYELGYNDPNYFARFFRGRAEMSPGQYRKLSQKTVHG